MSLRYRTRELRILDFDSECRPMHYSEWRPESQVTGIAWSWYGEEHVHCEVLDQDLGNECDMLDRFLTAYDKADIVTGHYIRKHDLPLMNEASIRCGFGNIMGKLASDTQADLVKTKSLGKSQENLAITFQALADKHHMTGAQWRAANSLTWLGKEGTRKRVVDDVLQHKALRVALIREGMLKAPSFWTP